MHYGSVSGPLHHATRALQQLTRHLRATCLTTFSVEPYSALLVFLAYDSQVRVLNCVIEHHRLQFQDYFASATA